MADAAINHSTVIFCSIKLYRMLTENKNSMDYDDDDDYASICRGQTNFDVIIVKLQQQRISILISWQWFWVCVRVRVFLYCCDWEWLRVCVGRAMDVSEFGIFIKIEFQEQNSNLIRQLCSFYFAYAEVVIDEIWNIHWSAIEHWNNEDALSRSN